MPRRIPARLLPILLVVGSIALPPSVTATDEIEYNLRLPLADDFDSCSDETVGETVFVTGTQHIVGRYTLDGSGQEHFVFHRNIQGTGIGTESGAEYVLIDTGVKVSLEEVDEGDVRVFIQQYETRFIRKGEPASDDDLIARNVTRIVATPDGTITVDTEFISAVCA